VELITTERKRLFTPLRTRPDQFQVQSGAANFFLVQWLASESLDDLLRVLLERRLYVRDARNFRTLESNWFYPAFFSSRILSTP